jgi:hypothetical protein
LNHSLRRPSITKRDTMIIELNPAERDVMISLLDAALADVRQEIYRTEQFEYKENLRVRKSTMEGILGQLIGPKQRPGIPLHPEEEGNGYQTQH